MCVYVCVCVCVRERERERERERGVYWTAACNDSVVLYFLFCLVGMEWHAMIYGVAILSNEVLFPVDCALYRGVGGMV